MLYEVIEGDNDSLPIVVAIRSGKYADVTVAYTKLHFSHDPCNPFVKFEFDIVDTADIIYDDETFLDIEETLTTILLDILGDIFGEDE